MQERRKSTRGLHRAFDGERRHPSFSEKAPNVAVLHRIGPGHPFFVVRVAGVPPPSSARWARSNTSRARLDTSVPGPRRPGHRQREPRRRRQGAPPAPPRPRSGSGGCPCGQARIPRGEKSRARGGGRPRCRQRLRLSPASNKKVAGAMAAPIRRSTEPLWASEMNPRRSQPGNTRSRYEHGRSGHKNATGPKLSKVPALPNSSSVKYSAGQAFRAASLEKRTNLCPGPFSTTSEGKTSITTSSRAAGVILKHRSVRHQRACPGRSASRARTTRGRSSRQTARSMSSSQGIIPPCRTAPSNDPPTGQHWIPRRAKTAPTFARRE